MGTYMVWPNEKDEPTIEMSGYFSISELEDILAEMKRMDDENYYESLVEQRKKK
jgi:hypothetical protein